jgi:hypothetical protein
MVDQKEQKHIHLKIKTTLLLFSPVNMKGKVKQTCYRSGMAQRVP